MENIFIVNTEIAPEDAESVQNGMIELGYDVVLNNKFDEPMTSQFRQIDGVELKDTILLEEWGMYSLLLDKYIEVQPE